MGTSTDRAQELAQRVDELEHAIRELEAEREEIHFLKQDKRLKETYLIELRRELAESAVRERDLQTQVRLYRDELATLKGTHSWRITAPLRSLVARVRRRGS